MIFLCSFTFKFFSISLLKMLVLLNVNLFGISVRSLFSLHVLCMAFLKFIVIVNGMWSYRIVMGSIFIYWNCEEFSKLM